MNKIYSSFIVMIIILSLSFPTIVIGNNIDNLEVNKRVWDGVEWVESIAANVGDIVRFNITITYHKTNHPNATYCRNISVVDILPDCLEYINAQPIPDGISGNMIYWNFTDFDEHLADGESHYIEFETTVISSGVNVNNVEATGEETCSGIILTGSDQASVVVCDPNPAINLTKKVDVDGSWGENAYINVGDNVSFKIIVENIGDIDLTNVTVTDDLPAFLTYNYDSNPIHSVATDHHIEWNIGTLAVGAIVEIIFSAHADMEGCDCNIANVTTNQGVSDEDDACVIAEVVLIPDIELLKHVWNGTNWVENITVNVSDDVDFKIIITNTGDVNLTNVVVVDDLPDFLAFNYDANITPTISSDHHIEWTFSTLDIDESIEITFSANVIYLDSGCNFAEVTTDEDVSDEDEACVVVTGMSVKKEIWNPDIQDWVDEINASVGDIIKFRITIEYFGDGSYTLYNIRVKDELPECLEYANNANPPETDISADGKTIWWNLSTILQAGDTIYITFYAYISETSGCGPCVNWANVTANECSGGTYYGNDSATVNADCPLIAEIGGPYFGEIDEDIYINGSATGGTPPYTFSWDLDDDGLYDDATGNSIIKSWSSTGTYVISLKVQDSKSRVDTEDTTVTISQDNNPPDTPSKPTGPESGESDTTYTFSSSATDPNDDDIRYGWDLDGDGVIDKWTSFYNSGSIAKITHSWSSAGTYHIKVKAEDTYGALSQFSEVKTIVISGNNAPNKPSITGPSSGKVETSYSYSSTAIDIDGDQIYYLFDWGDGTNSGWKGPYNSGDSITESHIWNSQGTFTVKVKAKDINNVESVWSDPLSVSMPHSKILLHQFLQKLLMQYPYLQILLQRLLSF
jgi:uncharacterized repeat protein (TIGR01451 family)/fimbrial isopeptide formation D2 family protein